MTPLPGAAIASRPMSAPRRQDSRTARTRRALQQAFIALLGERGYERATVREVLERADVGRTTFYAHFPNKAALLDGVLPQSAAISSAYVSAFNDYVRKDLKFGENREYKPVIEVWRSWDFLHKAPGSPMALPMAANVMLDLAIAMKYNPHLKVLLNAGYFDLATPFYQGVYEMQHLPIPPDLQKNIEFQFYESGHMVYAHQASLKAIHDNVAAFIVKSENSKMK